MEGKDFDIEFDFSELDAEFDPETKKVKFRLNSWSFNCVNVHSFKPDEEDKISWKRISVGDRGALILF